MVDYVIRCSERDLPSSKGWLTSESALNRTLRKIMSSYQAIFTVLRDYNEKLLQEKCPPPISRKYKNAYKDWPFFDIRPHGACTVDGHHQGNETSKSKIDLEIFVRGYYSVELLVPARLVDSDNRFRGIVEAMSPVPFKKRKLRPRGRDVSPKQKKKARELY